MAVACQPARHLLRQTDGQTPAHTPRPAQQIMGQGAQHWNWYNLAMSKRKGARKAGAARKRVSAASEPTPEGTSGASANTIAIPKEAEAVVVGAASAPVASVDMPLPAPTVPLEVARVGAPPVVAAPATSPEKHGSGGVGRGIGGKEEADGTPGPAKSPPPGPVESPSPPPGSVDLLRERVQAAKDAGGESSKSYRWQERAALWSFPFALIACGVTIFGVISGVSQERRTHEEFLTSVVREESELDPRPIERVIRRFAIEHRDELETLALEPNPSRQAASRIGRRLQSEISNEAVGIGPQCRVLLVSLNRADEASLNSGAFKSARGQLEQSLRSFASRGLVPCVIATETNATRVGLFVARYFYGSQQQPSALEVLHFESKQAGLTGLAKRLEVPMPSHYQGPSPSGDLKLASVGFPPCTGTTWIPLRPDGRLSPEWDARGTFVHGNLLYRFRPHWPPSCGGDCVCAEMKSTDGLDLLQLGFAENGDGFARIKTRFTEVFTIAVPTKPPDQDGLVHFRLTWDFQRMDGGEAVELSVNGLSGAGSPDDFAEPF